MSLKKTSQAILILSLGLVSSEAFAYQYNGSDIVKYALSAHGIAYKLRNKKGSLDAWKVEVSKAVRIKGKGSWLPKIRWGNTDCSGLASAAIRIKGWKKTTNRRKNPLGTWHIFDAAKTGKYGLGFVSKQKILHGDILNRIGSPYGHVLLYNGKHRSGMLSTVEARCTKCGVGKFANRSMNNLRKYKTIRSGHVYHDIKSSKKILPISSGSGADRRY